MQKMKLSTKLLVAFLAVGILPASIIGLLALRKAGQTIEQQSYEKLIAMRDVKKDQLDRFFSEREGDLAVLTENVKVLEQEAFKKLSAVQELKKSQVEDLFQRVLTDAAVLADSEDARALFQDMKTYHDARQFGESDTIDTGSDEYQAIYDKWYPTMAKYVKELGYYDVFLICAKHGHVLFTEAKESDLGANLGHGPLKSEGLGRLWKQVTETGQVCIEDFRPYSPSAGAQACFVGAPVKDESGQTVAVMALQVPTDPINQIVQKRDGMGRTGETYLVGKTDQGSSFRSDMLTMGDGEYVTGYQITTPYIERALTGQKVKEVFTDSSGKLVMVEAHPLEIPGLNWACVSKIDMEEAISLQAEGESEDFFTKYTNAYGYYDLFLITPSGDCFYTVCREADYGTNLVSGQYSDSGLGKLVRSVLQSKQTEIADFEPYAPSNGTPAAFIARPVLHNGDVELIVALQLSLKAINGIMQQRAGMGQTGETYLVGPDKRMRSDSFLDPQGHSVAASFAGTVKQNGCDTEAVQKALAGNSEAKIITDYNGNPVLSAFAPVRVGDTTWALLAEIDEAEAFAARRAIVYMICLVLAIAIGTTVTLALLITRSITRPINRIIAALGEGSEQVTSASSQVSAASQSLAEGATEQAAGLEETSSSLEEMSSMTKQNADNAQQANTLSDEASRAAVSGNEAMERMNAAIQEIQKSSDETAKIIKVIDEIAFQTNLLALNAAVEAARAGEAGKGFAVVAEEVRNLAMRSAEAAKNTASMIEESVKNAGNGVDIASEVGKQLQEIVTTIQKTSNLVGEIAAASQEQAQGIDQVNTAVAQMDKVTQQNAANAEESASASEELSAQAESMKEVVSQLVALVGGSNTQATGKPRPRVSVHRDEHPHHAVKPHRFGRSDEAFHKIATDASEPKAAVGSSPKSIPLENDEEDWSHFNA